MPSPKAHFQYGKYVVRHKAFVLAAGLKTGAPLWRLLVHDRSKLSRAEWGPYVRMFYGTEPPPMVLQHRYGGRPNHGANSSAWQADRQAAFDRAWLHHQHANPHHWQHWLLRQDDGPTLALRMPEPLVREMVADWMGASRAITGAWEVKPWLDAHRSRMFLHADTWVLVDRLVDALTNPTEA